MPNCVSSRTFRSFLVVTLLLTFVSTGIAWCQSVDFSSKLSSVSDPVLRKTLTNGIKAGVIATPEDFDRAITQAAYAERDNPAVDVPRAPQAADQITQLASKIQSIDSNAINVTMLTSGSKLFADLTCAVPPVYTNILALDKKFNPEDGVFDEPQIDSDVNAFLQTIANDPCITYALQVTNTTISDLKANWFGRGNAFKHVFNGELKGTGVSGYHFWYKFYVEERNGTVHLLNNISGNDMHMFTGSFSWDPDGSGPLPTAKKPKGGFVVGASPCAILALGHIALQTAKKVTGQVPSALQFMANINGASYSWQLYTMNGCIRSLYPICGAPGDNYDHGSTSNMIQNYYQLESPTIH